MIEIVELNCYDHCAFFISSEEAWESTGDLGWVIEIVE